MLEELAAALNMPDIPEGVARAAKSVRLHHGVTSNTKPASPEVPDRFRYHHRQPAGRGGLPDRRRSPGRSPLGALHTSR